MRIKLFEKKTISSIGISPPLVRLIVTLLVCFGIFLQREHIPATVSIVKMTLKGEPIYCSPRNSIAATLVPDNAEINRISKTIRLIKRDPAAGLDLIEMDFQRVWVPNNDKLYGIVLGAAEQKRGIYDGTHASVQPGDVVLDAGAHIGTFVKHALKRGASRVIAIEPVPANIECLRRNCEAEIAKGLVTIYPKGVWNRPGFLEIHIDSINSAHDTFVMPDSVSPLAGQQMKLPVTTIDALCAELGLGKVDFVKMDIEGSEREALKGAGETIKQFRPRMAISVYHMPDDPVVIPKIIRANQSYRQEYGNCFVRSGKIVPEVFFYY